MDLQLSDKVAVVTGASKGIGLSITRALADEGALVIAGARTTERLEGLPRVDAVQLDLTTSDGPAKLVRRAIELHGRLDVLVNNVGAVRLRLKGFLAMTDEDFEWAMQINFFTAVRATRAALDTMVKQGRGAIVNVASINSFFHPDSAVIDYGAAKAALVNFSKAIAAEFGPRGIRINSVSPGPVDTDLWLGKGGVAETVAQATGVDAATARTRIVAGMGGIPSGRFSTPDEVAALVVMLASERAANVTGANYVIDGGLIKST
jgi:NAD(P)-dependent dehydrogenase (short-subunit alcohol dehydrogenase family)